MLSSSSTGRALFALLLTGPLLQACESEPSSRLAEAEPEISREEAIRIAVAHARVDTFMPIDPDERLTWVREDEEGLWHISFPGKPGVVVRKGGEPHIFVSRTSGEITRVYYTR